MNNRPGITAEKGLIAWFAANHVAANLLMLFILAAGLISAFARYANGISGSDAFMPDDMKDAPEILIPAEFQSAGKFLPTCSPKALEYYTAIWTELRK